MQIVYVEKIVLVSHKVNTIMSDTTRDRVNGTDPHFKNNPLSYSRVLVFANYLLWNGGDSYGKRPPPTRQ